MPLPSLLFFELLSGLCSAAVLSACLTKDVLVQREFAPVTSTDPVLLASWPIRPSVPPSKPPSSIVSAPFPKKPI